MQALEGVAGEDRRRRVNACSRACLNVIPSAAAAIRSTTVGGSSASAIRIARGTSTICPFGSIAGRAYHFLLPAGKRPRTASASIRRSTRRRIGSFRLAPGLRSAARLRAAACAFASTTVGRGETTAASSTCRTRRPKSSISSGKASRAWSYESWTARERRVTGRCALGSPVSRVTCWSAVAGASPASFWGCEGLPRWSTGGGGETGDGAPGRLAPRAPGPSRFAATRRACRRGRRSEGAVAPVRGRSRGARSVARASTRSRRSPR